MTAILFLKAAIRHGAMGDLFDRPVQVEGHLRGGAYVAPYSAIRHIAPPKLLAPAAPVAISSPQAETPAAMDDATMTDHAEQAAETVPEQSPEIAAISAAWDARTAARKVLGVSSYRAEYPEKYGHEPEVAALIAANDAVAEAEIAAAYHSPTTAKSIRALYALPDTYTVPETFMRGPARPRKLLYRRAGTTGRADMLTLRRTDGVTMGQWYLWNYGQRVDGGYWEKHGKARPLQEAIAWKAEKEAEWERAAEAHRAQMEREEAEQAIREEARRATLAAKFAEPLDMGADPIPPGNHGAVLVEHAYGPDASPGYSLAFPYSAPTIAAVKAIPGRKWDAEGKRWFIPAARTAELREMLDAQPKPRKKRELRTA